MDTEGRRGDGDKTSSLPCLQLVFIQKIEWSERREGQIFEGDKSRERSTFSFSGRLNNFPPYPDISGEILKNLKIKIKIFNCDFSSDLDSFSLNSTSCKNQNSRDLKFVGSRWTIKASIQNTGLYHCEAVRQWR